ncbi:NAD-dependent epimerase/dehydratase family protein [Zhihengliuella sp. ISTPL4]|uniref:NAD-dependent epimerase/dehydratase family protein n=1 Tax=Zhihengliuella sp. ISTPL4 TaxID=2058657 RepID=UPI000C7B350A|nr:NAD-dependent epimerase/dehydratase family protein [Zhihengliuella sp. ISTPL4]
MRVVVTGARGFVGRALIRQLESAGGHEIRPVDSELDLRDEAAVRRLLEDARPDVVIHLGGVSGPMVAADDPVRVTAVNAVGTITVLDAAAALDRPPLVIVASSIAAVEQALTEPRTVYAATKRFVEDAAGAFRARGVRVIAARLGSVYGPGRSTDHVVDRLARSILRDGEAVYDPEVLEPLVHVDDVARLILGLVTAAARHRLSETYTFVQALVPHEEIARTVAAALGKTVMTRHTLGTRLRWTEPLDSRALLRDTGMAFAVPLSEGLARTASSVTA